jgi:hypothetical protein
MEIRRNDVDKINRDLGYSRKSKKKTLNAEKS